MKVRVEISGAAGLAMVGHGTAWRGSTHCGEESPQKSGKDRQGTARQSPARQGAARQGMARLHTLHPKGCRSVARLGEASRGEEWHGKHTASHGVPQFGAAQLGEAGPGKAGQGKHTASLRGC